MDGFAWSDAAHHGRTIGKRKSNDVHRRGRMRSVADDGSFARNLENVTAFRVRPGDRTTAHPLARGLRNTLILSGIAQIPSPGATYEARKRND